MIGVRNTDVEPVNCHMLSNRSLFKYWYMKAALNLTAFVTCLLSFGVTLQLASAEPSVNCLQLRVDLRDKTYKELRIGELRKYQLEYHARIDPKTFSEISKVAATPDPFERGTRSTEKGIKDFKKAQERFVSLGDSAMEQIMGGHPMTRVAGQDFSRNDLDLPNGYRASRITHIAKQEKVIDNLAVVFPYVAVSRRYEKDHPLAIQYKLQNTPADLKVILSHTYKRRTFVMIARTEGDTRPRTLAEHAEEQLPPVCWEAQNRPSEELVALLDSEVESVAEHLAKLRTSGKSPIEAHGS